jgi:hypothetical protein
MCCDVCALVLSGSWQHTPAGALLCFRDAGLSHQTHSVRVDSPAPLRGFAAQMHLSSPRNPQVWLPAGCSVLAVHVAGEQRVFGGYCVIIGTFNRN